MRNGQYKREKRRQVTPEVPIQKGLQIVQADYSTRTAVRRQNRYK